jgi:LmbE family N-acetylglucosaminyl deacetylase
MASGFDPQLPGTAEALWRALLDRAGNIEFPHGNLVVVAPHPDDETFGAGGVLAQAYRRRQRCLIVSVTDGEAARPELPTQPALRRAEVEAALRKLGGTPADIVRLGLPDGTLAANELRLARELDALIAGIQKVSSAPLTLVSPYEQDGHPDHDAVGRVCARISRTRGCTHWRFMIWGWHQLNPDRFVAGRFVKVQLSDRDRTAKRAALRCFPTQTQPTGASPPIVPPHVLDYFARPYEAFLCALPSAARPALAGTARQSADGSAVG